MQIDWELTNEYADSGGPDAFHDALAEALAVLPREHLRQLAAITIEDEDPRGKALGIWRHDHRGVGIALYAGPHVRSLVRLPPEIRSFALRLHFGYTLFHEVGHHVTRFLNKRTAPPRKAAAVEQKIERWADEYAEKRLGKLVERWRKPGGLAETASAKLALDLALKSLRFETLVSETAESAGTIAAVGSS